MTNATVRAKARPMPKPKPGSPKSIRRQVAELESATALLNAVKVAERDTAEPDEDFADMRAFGRAYARWLKARAAIRGDEFTEDNAMALFEDERAAIRELFSLRAVHSEDVWHKFEAFEADLTDERVIGRARESLLMLGLGAIKADLLNFGIGRDA